MKWRGYWQGIELISENKDDKSFLKQFLKRFPKKAEHSYDSPASEMETSKRPDSEGFCDDKDNKGGFTITLPR